jgi:hypothetical protein
MCHRFGKDIAELLLLCSQRLSEEDIWVHFNFDSFILKAKQKEDRKPHFPQLKFSMEEWKPLLQLCKKPICLVQRCNS